jgi:hypothetical protein
MLYNNGSQSYIQVFKNQTDYRKFPETIPE